MKKQTKLPLVSVLMPVYNGSQYVAVAIESILNQTYRKVELVIVDDASTDSSWEIISKFQKRYPKRITSFQLKKNRGSTGATNHAFKNSSGELIAIMDADDISHKNRIAKQVAYLLKHPKVVVVGTQASVINSQGNIIGEKTFPTKGRDIYKKYIEVHPIIHPTVMIKRSLLPTTKQLYVAKYGIHDDYYNMFRLLKFGTFANLSERLLFYRIHGKNNSLQDFKKSYWQILKIRLDAIWNLSYSATTYGFGMMIIQTVIAMLLSEKMLRFMYFTLKGLTNKKLA